MPGQDAVGDYVCPEYTHSGTQTTAGVVKGEDNQVQVRVQAIVNSAIRAGAELLPATPAPTPSKPQKAVKSKPGKNVMSVKTVYETPVIPEVSVQPSTYKPMEAEYDPQGIDLSFKNDFGTISLIAAAVLEEETGFLIVFKNKKELRFVPKPGDTPANNPVSKIALEWIEEFESLIGAKSSEITEVASV